MDGFFSVSYEFAEKYVRFAKPEFIQLYIYLKYLVHKDGFIPNTEELAAALDIPIGKIRFSLDFWVSRGELLCKDGVYSFPSSAESQKKPTAHTVKGSTPKSGKIVRPSYSMAEINAASKANSSVSGLFYQAETVLNKILTPSDMEMLYSFVDWLGLPVEVITMLLSYAAKCGKTGRRYMETLAIDWSERGIDTFEAAEAHVRELEAADSEERKIRGILGIYDRALSSYEKKFITAWSNDERINPELISLAYDRTIQHTSKLSLAYMNKILQTWAESGYTNESDIANNEKAPSAAKKDFIPKKTGKGISNYVDTNSIDYSELEKQLMDMIDEGE